MELNRKFFKSDSQISFLGTGELGGKAKGLEFINSILTNEINKEEFSDFEINIPKMIVIRTDVFDNFMETNELWDIALSEKLDNRIALAFQKADLPCNSLSRLKH